MGNQTPKEPQMHTRSTDDDHPLKITREIPLPWLIGLGIALAVAIAQNWLGQEKTADAVLRLTVTVAEQTKQIQAMSVELGSKNLKDVEHDLKFGDIERRLGLVENRK
jgi:hypothetical protein